MIRDTVIVCPELTSGSGGLADYTLRVAENWPSLLPLRFVVPETEGGELPSLPDSLAAIAVKRSRESLWTALPQIGGAVLLQYSAYGFDHFGYPRWLLRGLQQWKARTGGLLAIMFHEIWTVWPFLNKNYFVQQLHRRDIRTLLRYTDAVFTSTASQAEHLQTLAPKSAIEVLPVGSNVRRAGNVFRARTPGVAALFGLAGTRCRALEKMQAELQLLAQRKVIVKIITVGAGEAARERRLLESLALCDGFEQRGKQGESELSELLLTVQFGISDQDDLSLTKSGSFMAYAAHGLAIISSCGGATNPEPGCWLVTPQELVEGVEPNELQRRAEKLLDWQKRTASWPNIAEQFARGLQLPETVTEIR